MFLVLVLTLQGSAGADRAGQEPAVIDGPTHDGEEVAIDFPQSQRVKNFGAPRDGLGLCVFASLTMAARWHGVGELDDLIHRVQEGGGWPEKVDAVLKKEAPNLRYVQYEGLDPAILDLAMLERSPVCVTYGLGELYRDRSNPSGTIYHMVLLVHLSDRSAGILDNNFVDGEYTGKYFWMSRAEFLRRWAHPSGKGWAVRFLAAPPPLPPHNGGGR